MFKTSFKTLYVVTEKTAFTFKYCFILWTLSGTTSETDNV